MKKLLTLFFLTLLLISAPAFAGWFNSGGPFNSANLNLSFQNAVAAIATLQKLKSDTGGGL